MNHITPTEAPACAPSRKKPNVAWWLGGAFLLPIGLFCYQLFGPNPPIIISTETTYITEPLRPDGLPDYEQYLFERSRQGVAPDENAATLLWQAIWPGDLKPSEYRAICDELGIDEIPSPSGALQPAHGEQIRNRLKAWLAMRAKAQVQDETIDRILDKCVSHSWQTAQLPPLADWVQENRLSLDLIMEAAGRPRFYSPSPSLIDDEHGMIIDVTLPGVAGARDAARSLSIRAMWHLGEDRPDKAWHELLAIHRLNRLVCQGLTLVELQLGADIATIAHEGTVALLGSKQMTSDYLRKVMQDQTNLPQSTQIADRMEVERIMLLDIIIRAHFGEVFQGPRFMVLAADWNQALRDANVWHDRIETAISQPTFAERMAAIDDVEKDLRSLDSRARDRSLRILVNRQARSDIYSAIFVSRLLPSAHAATRIQDRIDSLSDLSRIAAALAIFRAEHGRYPESLDALVPEVLPQLPVDLYHAQPFVYRRDGEGYLLYSAGENGVDDGGSNEQMSILAGRSVNDLPEAEQASAAAKIPAGADDMSIRVPRPAFKLPDPPAPNL